MQGLISVIVSTYNWPEALNLVLLSLSRQTDRQFEVIVADDGSRSETTAVVNHWQKVNAFPLQHSWQADQGFRLARSRNKAVTLAQGDYLVFMDGDCLVRSDFVAQHRRLAQSRCVLAGQRILLSQAFTQSLFASPALDWLESPSKLSALAKEKKINRAFPARTLPLGPLRLMRPRRWQLLRGCNWSLFKSDFLAVGGQDEAFEGWGYEDSDMAVRLINSGCRMKWGAFTSPCFHLWHRESDRSLSGKNLDRLHQLLATHQTHPVKPMASVYESTEPHP